MSFINSRDINVIGVSEDKIFAIIRHGFIIYSCGKIVIKCYRYGQQFTSKQKRLYNSKISFKQLIININCLNDNKSVILAKKFNNLTK